MNILHSFSTFQAVVKGNTKKATEQLCEITQSPLFRFVFACYPNIPEFSNPLSNSNLAHPQRKRGKRANPANAEVQRAQELGRVLQQEWRAAPGRRSLFPGAQNLSFGRDHGENDLREH